MLGETDWLDSSAEPHCTGSHRKVTVIWRGCGAAECCIKKHIHGELTERGEGVMGRGCISSRGWLQVEGRQGRGGHQSQDVPRKWALVFSLQSQTLVKQFNCFTREQRRMNERTNEWMNAWIRVHLTISPRWPTVFAFCRAQSQRPVVEGTPLASLSVRDWLMVSHHANTNKRTRRLTRLGRHSGPPPRLDAWESRRFFMKGKLPSYDSERSVVS